MSDFQRIKSNVELMASKNAPPQDIDGYLATEGYTPEKFKSENSPSLGGTALRYSAASGLANLADAIPNTLTNLANLGIATYGVGKHALTGSNDLPEPIAPDALSGWSKIGHETGLINEEYKPTTGGGRIVDFATQALTGGGVRPGVVAKNLAAGMVKPVIRDVLAAAATGAAAGTANAATHDISTGNQTVDNTIKAVAPLLAGMATGSLIASKGTGADRAAAAMQGLNNEKPIPWYKLDTGKTENVSTAIKQARALRALGDKEGTPVTDYEAIQAVTGINPKMQTQQRIAEQSDAAATTLTPMMQNRPKVNAALFKKIVDQISPEEARPDSIAGQVKQAAIDADKSAQKFRSEAASPDYKAQRASDSQAMDLIDESGAIAGKIDAGTKWKNDAVQQAGKWYQNSHEMINKAQDIASRNLGWAGGKGVEKFNKKADEYKAATMDAVSAARERQAHIDKWQNDLNVTEDAIASKNLPHIDNQVKGFLADLDKQIRVAGPTKEAAILKSFRDELAPNGERVLYPSQLESIYKSNRDKLDLGLDPTPEQKTTAGVLGNHVKNLDSLIQEVSPAIKQGRKIYSEISKDIVEPLRTGQIGKLSRSDEIENQARTFLPRKPKDINENVIAHTVDKLVAENPEIVKKLLGVDLRGDFNESNQGTNAMGASQFQKLISDNPQQKANLIQALKSSGVDPEGMTNMLDIYKAQGYKPPVNSATSPMMEESAKLGGAISAVARPLQAIPKFVDQWRNSGASADLAKAMTTPYEGTGPMPIENLARMNGAYSPIQQQILISLLLANKAAREGQ